MATAPDSITTCPSPERACPGPAVSSLRLAPGPNPDWQAPLCIRLAPDAGPGMRRHLPSRPTPIRWLHL